MDHKNPLIAYSRGTQNVMVYHYFVHMTDKEPSEKEAAAAEAAW